MKLFLNVPSAVRMTFILPSLENMDKSAKLTLFALQLIYRLKAYRPSQKQKEKSEKNRLAYEQTKNATEKKQQEKQERIQTEKDTKWKNMTPEQKKKEKDLQEKRAKNNMKKKFKVR